ncbi:MAG: hypothetical protein AAFV85_23120 [Cyanobacteria bacterium J06634_6]
MSKRNWLYFPATGGRAALYRIDSPTSSELLVNIGNTIVSLGSYIREIPVLKSSYLFIREGDGSFTETFTSPTPVTAQFASVSTNNELDTRRLHALLPPGDTTVDASVPTVITGDGGGTTTIQFKGYTTVGGSGLGNVINEFDNAGSFTYVGTGQRRNSYHAAAGANALEFRTTAGTGTSQTSASVANTFNYTIDFRPLGYLSIAPDGVVYCQTKYLDINGDLFADYFVIQRSGSFTKATYGFNDMILVDDDDWRGDAFEFVGVIPTLPVAFTAFKENQFLNSNQPNPGLNHTEFIGLEAIAEAETGTTFSGDLLDASNNVIRSVNFIKPAGAVALISAVALP